MEIKQQEGRTTRLRILLNKKTYRPLLNYKFKHFKGKGYIDIVTGITDNTEKYLQQGDILQYKQYKFTVKSFLNVDTAHPRCLIETNQFVPKKILNEIIKKYEPTKTIQ